MTTISLDNTVSPYQYEKLILSDLDADGVPFGVTIYVSSIDDASFLQGSSASGVDVQDAIDTAASPYT